MLNGGSLRKLFGPRGEPRGSVEGISGGRSKKSKKNKRLKLLRKLSNLERRWCKKERWWCKKALRRLLNEVLFGIAVLA
jgi:hypothetical protein